MCVTSLLCGPRVDLWPFYGFLYQRFYKGLSYFECYATMPMFADAHISSLGNLCFFSLISEEDGEPWDEDAQQERKSSLRKISSPLAP